MDSPEETRSVLRAQRFANNILIWGIESYFYNNTSFKTENLSNSAELDLHTRVNQQLNLSFFSLCGEKSEIN